MKKSYKVKHIVIGVAVAAVVAIAVGVVLAFVL